ncbi:MAG: GxxExxY protein, partial [Nitrospira sp.]
AALEVHNVLGGGLAEEIYQQSLEVELGLRSIPYRRKHQLAVHYKGSLLATTYIPDLVVFDRIIVELKSVAAICTEHDAQLMNYLRITRSPVGYLINFAPIGKLEFKRFVCSEYDS